MASKHSLTELMSKEGLTRNGLAASSGLSVPTVNTAMNGSGQTQLNTTSATAIAETFGVQVGDINWPGGLSNRGRPALTGGKYTRRSD
jgi:DNA-binding XRE family transcriptional regulator